MKPELEQLDIASSNQSIQFFKIETDAFVPFWHYHPEIELTFILQGEGTRIVGNSIETFTSHDLVLVGKNVPHNWISLDREAPKLQKAFVFQFNTHIFSSFKECEHFFALFNKGKRGIHFETPSPNLIERITTFEGLNDLQRLSSLIELLHDLSQHQTIALLATEDYTKAHHHRQYKSKFAKVNNYILEHLDEKLTVAHMANYTHMVPQSFCRWFKQNSGHSFISFLNKTRIESACQMLIQRNQCIQDIAYSSGFESLSHFNRTFKTVKGHSPREFKKQQKNLY